MAFEVSGSTVTLEFGTGTVLEGASVKCSLDISVRDFLRLQREINAMRDGESTEAVEAAYKFFGDLALVEWDLVKKGEPLPANGDGLLQLPFASLNAIFEAWSTAITGSSPNSSGASPSGDTSEQAPSEATAA